MVQWRLALLVLSIGVAMRSVSADDADVAAIRSATTAVDDARLAAAADEPENWLSHGGTPGELRFSKLDQVNDRNVGSLREVWSFDTKASREMLATPVVVDGTLFTTGGWSVVFALDARTGREIWRRDPLVSEAAGRRACCHVANRSVAVFAGRVFAGTIDGRLVALDAATGELAWEGKMPDGGAITGPPRIAGGRVLVPAETLPGHWILVAYEPDSGELAWRAEIGPGDAIAHDAELGLVYASGADGAPLVALAADDGETKWRAESLPGESRRRIATRQLALATIAWNGKAEKVAIAITDDATVRVIDRGTGEVLAAPRIAIGGTTMGPTPELARSLAFHPGAGLAFVPLAGGAEGRLLAVDPARRSEAWHVLHAAPSNGGALATAGNLVFQGTGDGRFFARAATDGRTLWEATIGVPVAAAPSTYLAGGAQHVTVSCGTAAAPQGKLVTFALAPVEERLTP